MPEDHAKGQMLFAPTEANLDEKRVAASIVTDECCYSFHHADTSADGLLWCLCDGVALSAHFTDLHWEKTGHTLYLRVVRDAATGETRFRLVRVPTLRMIPLAVVPSPAPGALPTVRADDGGATTLPRHLAHTLARLVDRIMPGLAAEEHPNPEQASSPAAPSRKDAEDAAAILAATEAPLPQQLHRAGLLGADGGADALGAVCQALFALPEVRAVYARASVGSSLFFAGPANPAASAVLQLCKLGTALCSEDAAAQEQPSRSLVPAALQHTLALGGTPPGSTPARVLAALLTALDVDEPAYLAEGARCASLFRFPVEQRVECDRTHAVAYQWINKYLIELPIPDSAAPEASAASAAAAAPAAASEEQGQNGKSKNRKVKASECVAAWMAPVLAEHFQNPLFEAEGTAHVTRALARFPRVLAVALDRFDGAGHKVCRTRVAMPEVLDAGALRAHGGVQNDEQYIYDCPPVRLDGAVPAPACEPGSLAFVEHYFVGKKGMLEHADPALVSALTDLGFPEADARKAVVIVGARQRGNNDGNNDADGNATARLEAAVQWLIEHRDDVGQFFVDPVAQERANECPIARLQFGRSAVPPGLMSDRLRRMVALGFSARHARKALSARYANVERAVEWIEANLRQLVQEDALEDKAERHQAEAARHRELEAQVERKRQQRVPKYPVNADNARYELAAVVSHCTTADARDRYVAHIRVPPEGGDGKDDTSVWVLCNGATIAVAPAPPLDRGCLYLYRAAPK